MSQYLKEANNECAGSYWGETGKYQKEYGEVFDKLIPASGKSSTQEGEMLRAATRIYHDLFNNGGLNNTSGAVNYLWKFPGLKIPAQLSMFDEYAAVCEYMPDNDSFYIAADQIVDAVMEHIISREGQTTPNGVDMFDYSDDDVFLEEDEDEEWGW
jgi:hypothetical protein